MFKQLTGLPINHFVEIDFAGFWHVVNLLGGVYVPVDRRYYNPEGTGFQPINIQPGYQLLHGKDALAFVRFRHDQQGDFTRMQRQQLFLRELQRQSRRWSGDWRHTLKLIKAVTQQTTSDIDTLSSLSKLVRLVFAVNTSKVNTVHLEGATPMINGVSYVEATPEQVAAAVAAFTNPTLPPVKKAGANISKDMYTVTVHNTTTTPGLATSVAAQLANGGYTTQVGVDALESATAQTAIYAPADLATAAQALGGILTPADVHLVSRTPGQADGIQVFVGSQFDGSIITPTVSSTTTTSSATFPVQKHERYDLSGWQQLDAQSPIPLQMPSVWSSGLGYEEMRAYKIKTLSGHMAQATVAVGTTPQGGYFGVQTMRWLTPPAVASPDATHVVGGVKYLTSTRASTCTWWPGGTARPCTGSSTRWTTSWTTVHDGPGHIVRRCEVSGDPSASTDR